MESQLEMLDANDKDCVSRRAFVESMTALLCSSIASRAETSNSPLFRAINLNHVTLAASDLERTRKFYESILGLKPYKQDKIGYFLAVGDRFVGVDPASPEKEKVGIDHFCIGVQDFNEKKAREALAKQSIETFTGFGRGVHLRDPTATKCRFRLPIITDSRQRDEWDSFDQSAAGL